jgi:hypothetical protein
MKAYTEFKNFVKQYKNQYFYNCLLWVVQDIEFRTFRRLNLDVPKKERGQLNFIAVSLLKKPYEYSKNLLKQ